MSRRADPPPPRWMFPIALGKALWHTWQRRPARRPVLIAAVVVPLGLAAFMLMLPSQVQPVQAASPAPPVVPLPPSPRAAPAADERAFQQRNPMRLKTKGEMIVPPPPPPPAPTTPAPVPIQTPPPRMKLLGTYVMGENKYAVINLLDKGREEVFKERDTVPNDFHISVTKVMPREVELNYLGQHVTLKLDYEWNGQGGGGVSQAQPPPVPNYVPPPQVPDAQPAQTSGGDGQPRRLARAEVDSYLDNLNNLLTQVNVQPVFQAGQPAGFRMTDIQKGTILDQIGVQDGDTLRFVNGQRIDSVQSAFQLYNILKESTNVEITVIRNTRPVTLRYLIY